MWNRTLATVLMVGVIGTSGSAWSSDHGSSAPAPKFVPALTISLQKGLTAAESQGQPISGKYEVDDGNLELCVYTAKDGKFSEVFVDRTTGQVVKTEAITAGDDLVHAQTQMEAYSKSKTSLRAAVDRAELANPGYRAVSVTSTLSKGRPFAVVSLLQEGQLRSIAEPLG